MNEQDLKIFALGGLHEVGRNCYCLEKNEDLIIIDCGIKFVNNNLVSGTIPNFSYLQTQQKKIKGLFITHGHEDHIGGIPYLLQSIPTIPVYGSEFSISLTKQKLGTKAKNKWIVVKDETIIRTAEFRVSFFRVTHSIPQSFGLIIEVLADKLRLVITGDFKFDWTSIGETTDLAKLAETGKRGVDLLLSDSTNAEIPGSTPAEKKVISRLESLITGATGRVIITSFASNVYRLKKVIDIAKKTQKKIALLGSSLLKMLATIHKASLWKIDSSIFVKASVIGRMAKNKLIIFCTGSQGEEKAVLSRLAHQNYPGWKVEKDDIIILTSSPIMDNKLNIEMINNKLFALGAKIYENSKEDLLHASGHACQEDLKLMLALVKPRYFMPFHGDFRMLKSHGYLAQELGLPSENVFVCQNGEVVKGNQEKFFLANEKISAQPAYVFNKKLVNTEELNTNLTRREKMSRGGAVLIVLLYQEKWVPCFFTYGFINMERNKNLINVWKNMIQEYLRDLEPAVRDNTSAENSWKKSLEAYIESHLLRDWKKEKPYIHCVIENR